MVVFRNRNDFEHLHGLVGVFNVSSMYMIGTGRRCSYRFRNAPGCRYTVYGRSPWCLAVEVAATLMELKFGRAGSGRVHRGVRW